MSVADAKALAVAQLRTDEGLKLVAYPDPLSGGAPWTIGYGHTGMDVFPGLRWNVDQAEAQLVADVEHVAAELDTALAWWRTLDYVRAAVLLNMAFNMGVAGLLGFRSMLSAARRGDWPTASAQMLASTWATQVAARATHLAEQMRTGSHAALASPALAAPKTLAEAADQLHGLI